ncbi:MAG: ABC transporter permease [Planctomycetes bacterium]|nr:ABC transporter permease [Planctomycetota bacterium]
MVQLWAVARNLVIEVLRIRSLVLLTVVFFFVITFGFGYWLHTGLGTADHKVQTFISYSMSISAAFLAFLTIFFSIASVTRDIKYKQVFTVTTKPISRIGYLAGKFLGMAVLNLFLLFVVGALIFGVVQALAHYEPELDPDPEWSQTRLEHLVLVARKSVFPRQVGYDEAAFQQQVQEEVEKVIAQERDNYRLQDPEDIDKRRKRETNTWTNALTIRTRSVMPGDQITWHFSDLQPLQQENSFIFIRYKLESYPNPDTIPVIGNWWFGDKENVLYTGEPLTLREAPRVPHEFKLDAGVVSDNGDLYLAYENDIRNTPIMVVFPEPNPSREQIGIEALYLAGGFTGNFLRSLAAIYFRLLFLSIMGIALGAWLSYPVAVLTGLVFFFIGMCSNFITISVQYELGSKVLGPAKILMAILPQLAAYDPIPSIERGRLVESQMLGSCLLVLLLLKGGVIGLIGYLVFKFRELARVIV